MSEDYRIGSLNALEAGTIIALTAARKLNEIAEKAGIKEGDEIDVEMARSLNVALKVACSVLIAGMVGSYEEKPDKARVGVLLQAISADIGKTAYLLYYKLTDAVASSADPEVIHAEAKGLFPFDDPVEPKPDAACIRPETNS